jgi:hypothetical protein
MILRTSRGSAGAALPPEPPSGRCTALVAAAVAVHAMLHALEAPASGLRWVPFTGPFQPLKSLTSGGRNEVRSQYKPHGEFCPPGSYGVYHGNTSTAVRRGCCLNSAFVLTS